VIVVLFRARMTEQAGEDLDEMNDRMLEIARGLPDSGFVDMRSYTSDDGEHLAVVWWRDWDSLRRWREDPRHREAQQLGRERWFTEYEIQVTELVRESTFPGSAAE
jgi:heme-degrading monooxygenase HmoA